MKNGILSALTIVFSFCILTVSPAWAQNDETPTTATRRGGEPRNERVYFGKEFNISEGESLDSLVAIGAMGTVMGNVEEMVLIGSYVDTLGGEIGNLVMVGSKAELAATGSVTEEFVSVGSELELQPGAKITAEEVSIFSHYGRDEWGGFGEQAAPYMGWAGRIFWAISSFIFTLALGLIYIYLFPQFHRRTVDYLMSEKGPSIGFGILGYLLFIPGILFLIITILGILLIPIYGIAFGILVFLGYIAAASAVGRYLPQLDQRSEMARFGFGLFILKLVGLIPFLGSLVAFLLTAAGFGAVLREFWYVIKARRRPSERIYREQPPGFRTEPVPT